ERAVEVAVDGVWVSEEEAGIVPRLLEAGGAQVGKAVVIPDEIGVDVGPEAVPRVDGALQAALRAVERAVARSAEVEAVVLVIADAETSRLRPAGRGHPDGAIAGHEGVYRPVLHVAPGRLEELERCGGRDVAVLSGHGPADGM